MLRLSTDGDDAAAALAGTRVLREECGRLPYAVRAPCRVLSKAWSEEVCPLEPSFVRQSMGIKRGDHGRRQAAIHQLNWIKNDFAHGGGSTPRDHGANSMVKRSSSRIDARLMESVSVPCHNMQT